MLDDFTELSPSDHVFATTPLYSRTQRLNRSTDFRSVLIVLRGKEPCLRNYRRSLGLLLGTLLLSGDGSYPPPVHAQQLHLDPVALEILKAQTTFRRFYQERAEYQRLRDRERLSIPAYNIQLSRAVAVFHKHIQDCTTAMWTANSAVNMSVESRNWPSA